MFDNQPEFEFDTIAEQFIEQHRKGMNPSIEEIALLYPEFSSKITSLFPAMLMLDQSATTMHSPAEDSPTEEEAADRPLEVLGDYQVKSCIGKGGMGTVYLANHYLRPSVALKVLTRPKQSTRDIRRFEQEVRAVSKLHHNHIVPIYDFGVAGTQRYFSMKLVDGPNLAQVFNADPTKTPTNAMERRAARLKVQVRENWKQIAQLMVQATSALHHAHQQGVFHRDIKPANLMVDNKLSLWVTDFGLAKLKNEAEDWNLTKTGNTVGTVRYMAPEQFENMADERSDVFALGLCMSELLAMDEVPRPSGRPTPRRFPLIKPSDLNENVPAELDRIVCKACARSPEDRYQSAQEMESDLQAFLTDKPKESKDWWVSAAWRSFLIVASLVILASGYWAGRQADPDKYVDDILMLGSGAQVAVDENRVFVTSVLPLDAESSWKFNLTNSPDANLFSVDPVNGQISFLNPPNYESPQDANGDNKYEFVLGAQSENGSTEIPVSVTIKDKNEAPVFKLPGGQSDLFVDEGAGQSQQLFVHDPEESLANGLMYKITGGEDASMFAIMPYTGELTIRKNLDHAKPSDRDRNNVYKVKVAAQDQTDIEILTLAYGDSRNDSIVLHDTMNEDLDLVCCKERAMSGFTSQVIDVASGDGRNFHMLRRNANNTVSLLSLIPNTNGSFQSEIVSANCKLTSRTIAFATHDGVHFLIVEKDGGASAATYSAVLNSDGTFSRKLISRESGLPNNIVSISTVDGKSYFITTRESNFTRTTWGVPQVGGSFKFTTLDTSKKRRNCYAQATWPNARKSANTTEVELNIHVAGKHDSRRHVAIRSAR